MMRDNNEVILITIFHKKHLYNFKNICDPVTYVNAS